MYKNSIRSIAILLAAGLAVPGIVHFIQPSAPWSAVYPAVLLPSIAAGIGLVTLRRVRSEIRRLGREIARLRKEGAGAPIKGGGGPVFQSLARPINSLATQLAKPDPQVQAHQEMILEALRLVTVGRPYESLDHAQRVGEMCFELARLAGLEPEEAELLRQAAPLHDLGMAGIPDAVRGKKGQFTPADARIMEKHTELGYRLLRRLDGPVFRAAAIIAHEHHERWDGKGYPNRRGGEDLHVFSRILAIVDMFDAMQSCRVHRAAQSREKVLGIMQCQRGYHFDPQLLDIFMANLPLFFGILAAHGQLTERPFSLREEEEAPCLV